MSLPRPASLDPRPFAAAPYEELPPVDAHFQSRARREGELYDEVALEHLVAAGATVELGRHKIEDYPVDARIGTPNGGRYLVAAQRQLRRGLAAGPARPDTVAKVAQRAAMLHTKGALPLIVVTSHLPKPASATAHDLAHLQSLLGPWLVDVLATTGELRRLPPPPALLHRPAPAPASPPPPRGRQAARWPGLGGDPCTRLPHAGAPD